MLHHGKSDEELAPELIQVSKETSAPRRLFVWKVEAQEAQQQVPLQDRLEATDPIIRRQARQDLAQQVGKQWQFIDSVLANPSSSYRARLGVLSALNSNKCAELNKLSSAAVDGVIRASGDPDPTLRGVAHGCLISQASPAISASLLASLSQYGLYDAKITCVGVWDTVGALGIPVDPFGIDDAKCGFLDTNLHPDVLNAFHAVSIDERRREFPATLWTPPFAPGRNVEQVWFSGVHCDVGGGYSETGLSDITLSWVLKKALCCDSTNSLELINSMASPYLSVEAKHALDTIHESWSLLWGFPRRRAVSETAEIANSVGIRISHDSSYRPPNLQLTATGLAETYEVEDVVAGV